MSGVFIDHFIIVKLVCMNKTKRKHVELCYQSNYIAKLFTCKQLN